MPKTKPAGKTAYILFSTGVEDTTVQELLNTIASVPKGTKNLYILIATSGGSVTYGFAVYSILRGLPYHIIMHNIGSVDSIGVSMFLAADERYTTEHGTFLIHPVRSTVKNEAVTGAHLAEKLSCVKGEEAKIRKVICSRSSITEKELSTLWHSGELKNAAYALQKGLVQDVREVAIPANATLQVVKATNR